MRKVLIVVGAVIAIPALFVMVFLVRSIALQLIGYPVDIPPTELAEQISAENGDPLRCRRLQQTMPTMGPSLPEKRMLCIYTYAKLTSDPTACKLLLPSEYGLACISNLWPEVSGHVACGWNHTDLSIFECRDNGGLLHQSKNCEDFKNNQKQFSACLSYFAEKAKQSHQCAQIPDQSVRSFCETKMGAWEKYPELRGSFYFGQSAS